MIAAAAFDPARSPPASISELFAAFGAAGLRWSLLRPPEALANPEGDVDVLVAPGSTATIERILADAGFVLVPFPGPDIHAAIFDEEARRFVWIHVQATLRVAGAELPAGPVLDSSVEEDGIVRPADGLLLWILLLRALVDKGRLADRYHATVAGLARRGTTQPEQLESLARHHGIEPAAATEAAAASDWEALERMSTHRPPAPPSIAQRWIARLRQLPRLARPPGISVAVLGPDGAGKSSLLEYLDATLPLPTRVQYMGLTGGQMPKADALRVPGIVFLARVAIIWMRYARGLRQVAGGGIVLFDRYTLDGYVPSGRRLSPGARLSRRLQRHVVPMPDLILLLDASGETLHRRSGEYDAAVLESWRQAFAKLDGQIAGLVKLNAERPGAAVRHEAAALVWRRYGELRGRRPGDSE